MRCFKVDVNDFLRLFECGYFDIFENGICFCFNSHLRLVSVWVGYDEFMFPVLW